MVRVSGVAVALVASNPRYDGRGWRTGVEFDVDLNGAKNRVSTLARKPPTTVTPSADGRVELAHFRFRQAARRLRELRFRALFLLRLSFLGNLVTVAISPRDSEYLGGLTESAKDGTGLMLW